MREFSWVVDGQLAGMPRPGSSGALDDDLAFLQARGISLLVSLTEQPVDPAAVAQHGLELIHLPVADFTAPTQSQLRTFVETASAAMAAGRPVGVHCGAGKGRTGTFLAAYFVAQGMTAPAAIAHVRALRPGSIETADQELAVARFWEALQVPAAR